MTKTMKKITMMALVVMTMMVMLIAPVQAASKTKTTKVTLKAGQSKTLRVKTASKVKWSSSNKDIVTVNKKGKIIAPSCLVIRIDYLAILEDADAGCAAAHIYNCTVGNL